MDGVKYISSDQALAVRQSVLWPDKSIEAVKVAEDDLGKHLGYFLKGHLVGVISVFFKEGNCKIRKFAVLENYRGKGYGSELLKRALSIAWNEPVDKVWLRARVGAIGLYHRHGFVSEDKSKVFEHDGVLYQIMKIEKTMEG